MKRAFILCWLICFSVNTQAKLPDSCNEYIKGKTTYGRIVAMVDENGREKTNFIIDTGYERGCVSATDNEIRAQIMRNAFYFGKRISVETDSGGWVTGVDVMN
ncbi:TPA: hypothetical protein IDY85_002868 [Escherichia coli]|nr:hypothetical protein [Escherichia coli]